MRTNRSRLRARRLFIENLEDRRVMAFGAAVTYPVGTSPAAEIAGDFNGDGRLDLATANNTGSSVSLLLGNSDGTFQAAQTSPTGTNPLSLASGDFNADGKLDLVTANSSDVSVLFGNGSGGLASPVALGVSSTPSSVAVGDFNADGKMDLAVGGHTSYYIPPWGGCGYYGCYGGGGYWVNQPSVGVLLGNGSGGFGAETLYQFGNWSSTSAVAAADFNGDGKTDLVAATDAGTIAVLLSTGSTGLSFSPIYSSGSYTRSLVVADADGDTRLDLVTANNYTGNVSVLLGNGQGNFAYDASRFYATGAAALFAGVADFNGDGRADIATANGDGSVSVLLGTGLAAGASAMKPPIIIAGAGSPLGQLAIGQFNTDGRTDLAATNAVGNNTLVLLNDGLWPALDAPAISITDAAAVTEGHAGTVNANFTVSLSAAYSQAVTVVYATTDGSATANGDYQSQTSTLTFSPGETSKPVSIVVNGDRQGEANENFFVKLTSPTNGFIGDSSGTGTIVDDEPIVNIIDYVYAPEGQTGTSEMSFTVTLSRAYDQPVSVTYATGDLTPDELWWFGAAATVGVDYSSTAGTLTFAAGTTSQTIKVPISGDRDSEPDELFAVNLTGTNYGSLGYVRSLGTITNDEPYVWIDYYASQPEGNAGTSNMTFQVHLSSAYDVPVTVNYRTQDGTALVGSDYVGATGTVTIPAGSTEAPLVVQIQGDTLRESDEYLSVELTTAIGAGLSGNWATGYILDDDTPPSIYIDDASIVEGNSGTQTMTFTVRLSNPSGQAVSVNYATANSSAKTSDNDYVAKSGRLDFAPGETNKTISITVRGDTRKENNENFLVKLSSASGATIADGQATGTIWNDDGPSKGRKSNIQAASFDAALEELMASSKKRRK